MGMVLFIFLPLNFSFKRPSQPFLLLFQRSFFFCPDIGRRGLLTVDLISCHTPNKAIFQKARTPGFPGKLILHMHNLLQKEVERMSLGRNWWLGPSVTTLILPSFDLQQSLIWEIGNHYIVEIQGESVLSMDFWKKTQLCVENSGRKKRQWCRVHSSLPVTLVLGVGKLSCRDGLPKVHCGFTVFIVLHAVESSCCCCFNLNH